MTKILCDYSVRFDVKFRFWEKLESFEFCSIPMQQINWIACGSSFNSMIQVHATRPVDQNFYALILSYWYFGLFGMSFSGLHITVGSLFSFKVIKIPGHDFIMEALPLYAWSKFS